VGLLDRIRHPTGLTHTDAEARLLAIQQLPASDVDLLVPVVRGDTEPRVRRAAARRLRDPQLLSEVAAGDSDAGVREAATSILIGLALEERDEAAARAALAGLHDPRQLAAVARSAALESIGREALARLEDARALGSVARHGEHPALRTVALERLSDPGELLRVALKSPHRETALSALERIEDPEALDEIGRRARDRTTARRARARLRGGDGEDGATEPAREAIDRAAPLKLVESAEALLHSDDWEGMAARIVELQDAFIEDIPAVDDDLDERFREACRAARRRLLDWQEESALREQREKAHEETLAPRRALCERVEGCPPETADTAIAEAQAAWALLPTGFEGPEWDALERRFDEACRGAVARRDEAGRQQVEAQARSAAEESARAAVRVKKEAAARLERMCSQVEKLLSSEETPLGKLERALREVRSMLAAMPPLGSAREHDTFEKRLRAAQAELVPRVQGLRDTDRFQRWANAAVQEELCARMEDLARQADESEAEAGALARGLRDLMEKWKAAGPAPPERSLSLWNRFKAARDRVRTRCDAFHALQIEEQGVNSQRKQELCDKAEALSASTDWMKTAEAIKVLQAEWKAIGPAQRGQEKQLWERFRKACDHFFAERDADMTKRKDAWGKNLEARKALCEKAEALAESTDWKSAAAQIKALQAEWKGIGPVRRNQSEPIWNRFRGVCDRFFERFKNRDAIERQAIAGERELLCAEIEALAPPAAAVPAADGPASDEPASDGSATAAPPTAEAGVAGADQVLPAPAVATAGESTPPEGLVGRLREGLERWQRMRGLPHDLMAPLQARFFSAFDRVIQAYPQSFQGTSLDPEANRRRAEELCLRVEKIAPGGTAPAETELSPAVRLATMWREAMASNTMGGKAADEARWKAAAEETRKAQAAWQRLGYVPETARRALAARFDRACRSILDRAGAVVETGGAASGRPERGGHRGGGGQGRRPGGAPSGSNRQAGDRPGAGRPR
jgi:hypothetical protein